MVFAAGSWNWTSSSVSTALIFGSWTRRTPHYLGVTLDTQLTWPALVSQVGKKAVWPPSLTLSVRNGVLLYKQLIRPLMHYACPIWRSAARSHVRKLQVLKSKCLRIATNAPWYHGNMQIHEDLGTWWWRQQASLKRRKTSTSAATQKTAIFDCFDYLKIMYSFYKI
jgi:hypothetical protein